MTIITTRIATFFTGRLIGVDQFGNRYYQERFTPKSRRRRRWVMYRGRPEPSKVPSEWHGWLHYTLDMPPTKRAIRRYPWEKPYLPNLTGTVNAYVPPGHLLRGARRDPSTSDYEAWKP